METKSITVYVVLIFINIIMLAIVFIKNQKNHKDSLSKPCKGFLDDTMEKIDKARS